VTDITLFGYLLSQLWKPWKKAKRSPPFFPYPHFLFWLAGSMPASAWTRHSTFMEILSHSILPGWKPS